MDGGRVAIRPLGGACAFLLVGILACNGLASTEGPGGDFLRTPLAPYFRVADALSLTAAVLIVALLVLLARQVRRAARERERCRGVLEDIGEGVLVLDARGRIVSINAAMPRLFGYAAAELLGQPVQRVLPKGLPVSGEECSGRRKDGSEIHLEARVRSGAADTGATVILRDLTPSKKAHETLSTRETYLRMVVEQMPAILWTTDMELQITSTIGAGLAAVNLKARDVIGMSMLECLERAEVDCTPISAHMKALRGDSLSYEMEWKGRAFQVRVDPLRNGQKNITGTVGILVDVTEHKQAVAELKARHRQQAAVAKLGQRALDGGGLEGLFSEAVALIASTLEVESGIVLEAARDGRRFTPRASVGGRASSSAATVEQQAIRALRSAQPILLFDARQSAADSTSVSGICATIPGERRPFGVLATHTTRPRRFTADDSNFLQAVAHILAAAIERRQADEAQARLVAILEATTDVVAMTGTDRRLLYLNRAGRTLLGIGLQEDVSACSLTDFCPPSARLLLDESIARAVCDGAWSGEMTLRSRGGEEVAVSQVVLAHKSPSGAFEFLSTIARDARERQRLEAQLRQAQKMEAIGRLAGGIAHDFNNLLCIITGYSNLVADALPAGEPLHEFIGEITKAGDRAARLTQQLLAFSRKQMLVPRVLSLNSLLTDFDKMLRRLIGEDIELVLTLAPDLPELKADHSQIEQVLMNLAVNARDAMPRGGRLTIATTRIELDANALRDQPGATPGPYILLEVSDTGCGMDREVLAHLFEPFFTTKGQGKGTGLGLATVFGIVKQSGGHIEVRSEPGQGSNFRIFLPSLPPAESAEPSAPAAPAEPRGGVETLLVVEDEDGLRALACHTLRQRGYHVLEAANGEAALEVSRRYSHSIHLLLSDVVMPKMSGPALAERLVLERPDIKLLFMSGFTDSALFRHGVISGEVECLLKPFTPTDLAEKVREILDRSASFPAAC